MDGRGPDQSEVIAFGQQRHRPYRSKSLEGHTTLSLARPHMGDQRNATVIVVMTHDTGDHIAAAVGNDCELAS